MSSGAARRALSSASRRGLSRPEYQDRNGAPRARRLTYTDFLKAQDRVELQTRERAVERACGRLRERAVESVRAVGEVARQRERHARVERVAEDEAVHARVR